MTRANIEVPPPGGPAWLANRPEEAAVEWPWTDNTVLISICEPDRIPPSKYAPPPSHRQFVAVLRLYFHDYDPQRYKPSTHGLHPAFFTPDQADRVVRFARAFRGYNILVHCAAGISRSAGIVEALLMAFPEYQDKGWPRHPNAHVKSLMLRALGITPRGIEVEVGP